MPDFPRNPLDEVRIKIEMNYVTLFNYVDKFY